MSIKYLSLFGLVLLLSACDLKTPIEPLYEAYIGRWDSEVYVIEILPNGGATIDVNTRWNESRIEGTVRFKEEKIVFVGLDEDGGRIGLRIDRSPALQYDPVLGEITQMTLEGVVLIKQ